MQNLTSLAYMRLNECTHGSSIFRDEYHIGYNHGTNKAVVHLNLIIQQLATPPLGKRGVTAAPPTATNNTYNLIIGGKAYPLTYQITGLGNKVNTLR